MKNKPTVSVVIVNWNTRDLLNQTLKSLYKNTKGVTFETILVDNGSTDGSMEMVRRIFPRVKTVKLPVNKGFAAANNIGFTKAKGKYILLLNSDTIVSKSTLPVMSKFLDDHPHAGCVGCKHLNPDGSLQRSVDNFPSLLNDFLSYTELYRLSIFLPLLKKSFAWWGNHNTVTEVDWVNGACMMVKRKVIDDIGGLDEGFFIYAEELDWCFRMKEKGWKVFFTPFANLIHIGGQAMNKAASTRIILKYKGQYRFYRKHYKIYKYLILRSFVSIVMLIRIFLLLVMSMLPNKLKKSWETITQEPVNTGVLTMIRAYLKIITLPL